MAHTNNYIEAKYEWIDGFNMAEFQKTLVYYINGDRKWNGYPMAIRCTQMVVPPSQ